MKIEIYYGTNSQQFLLIPTIGLQWESDCKVIGFCWGNFNVGVMVYNKKEDGSTKYGEG